jgi:hypothetical protein
MLPALQFKIDAKGRITKRPHELLAADAREAPRSMEDGAVAGSPSST